MAVRAKHRRQTPLIVYASRTDNTRCVAEAMARPLGAECIAIEHFKDHHLRGRALIGLGSGVYWLRLESRLVDLAAKLPAGCRVFIFSTSGWRGRVLADFYQAELVKRLQRQGADLVGVWHCPGHDRNPLFKWLHISRGRPNEEDLRRAVEFAAGFQKH
jgi:flavodoxin